MPTAVVFSNGQAHGILWLMLCDYSKCRVFDRLILIYQMIYEIKPSTTKLA